MRPLLLLYHAYPLPSTPTTFLSTLTLMFLFAFCLALMTLKVKLLLLPELLPVGFSFPSFLPPFLSFDCHDRKMCTLHAVSCMHGDDELSTMMTMRHHYFW